MKQYKEEWDVVMDKLGRVAGLVNNVGASCEKYGLEEKDLPRDLRSIFESLETYAIHSLSPCRWLITMVFKGTAWNQGHAETDQRNQRYQEDSFAQGLATEG